MLEDAHMNLENTKVHYNVISDLTKGKKHLVLIDSTNYYTIDQESLKYAAKPGTAEGRVAAAHFTLNMANRLISNFFKLFYKSQIPIQTFNTKEEALRWLREQKNV